jgi:DNA-binding LacI/PurR family transcriptional regulator
VSVTIKDLARAAGVSVAKISPVLKGKGPVAGPVRDRIRGLAAEMHYVPHGAARSLITTKTSTICVLFACTEAGARVPGAFALAGVDDIPIARYLSPPLTSVQVPIDALGARALERLPLALDLKNHHEPVREVLPATLMVRRSCKCQATTRRPMRRTTPWRRTP